MSPATEAASLRFVIPLTFVMLKIHPTVLHINKNAFVKTAQEPQFQFALDVLLNHVRGMVSSKTNIRQSIQTGASWLSLSNRQS